MTAPQAGTTSGTFSLRMGQCTACGPYRTSNEDAVAVRQFAHLTLALVADGMGGNGMGATASQRAIEVVSRELCCRLSPLLDADAAQRIIQEAILQANAEILVDCRGGNLQGGSTLALATWRKDRQLHLAHVGDARAYLIRAGRIAQLTADHDFASALLAAGVMTREEIRVSCIRNVVIKHLGSKECAPDVQILNLQADDRWLLCTDGLHGPVAEEDLLQCLAGHSDLQSAAEALVRLALDRGSRDNVSCIVMEVAEELAGAEAATTSDRAGLVERGWLGWNDGCVVRLARDIHDSQRFEDLLILADALEEAGCPSQYLLGHCREPRPHLSACWALEWLLEKAHFADWDDVN